jgi:uncharacterized protein (TIGR02118 family)
MKKLICLVKRKAGLTPEQFREYYENTHVPLTLKLFPFFKEYRRNYIRHDSKHAPPHFKDQPGLDIDVITEIYFESESEYKRMLEAAADPAIQTRITQDEAQFMDRSSVVMFLVDECSVQTAGQSAR